MGKFQEEVTQPIASVLFPTEGEWLDEHHSFSVRYKAGEDLGLDMHTDDSDVTFNVCLGKPGFTAAGLTFCGIMGRPDHRVFRLVPDRRLTRSSRWCAEGPTWAPPCLFAAVVSERALSRTLSPRFL